MALKHVNTVVSPLSFVRRNLIAVIACWS